MTESVHDQIIIKNPRRKKHAYQTNCY